MAAKRRRSLQGSKSRVDVFKWIFKAFLTQVGCLSKQEFDELYPPVGASCDSLLDDTNGNTDSHHHPNYSNNNHQRTHAAYNGNDRHQDGFDDCLSECDSKEKKDKTGGTMFSLQNCTLMCDEQANGESYWVSFEEKSFCKGEEFKVYSGKMNGTGPKSGEKCVVKVFRKCRGTQRLCCCELKKSAKAKELARAYNSKVRDRNVRIRMATVYWAQMDEVSALKHLMFSGKRKLSSNEAVLFEDDVRVNEDKPNKPKHTVVYMDSEGGKKHCIAKDLEAFAHFTYHHSNGALVVCGLDGVQDDDGFFLKTPTIHSVARQYGTKDNGLPGIREMFRHHVCNDFCKSFIKPDMDKNTHQLEEADKVSVGKCSSVSTSASQQIFKRQESGISQPEDAACSPCLGVPALQWQESTISQKTLSSDFYPEMQRQGSNLSHNTESMSGYLEPSAPALYECNEAMFQPTPPPYSEMSVANWILGEQAHNCFIIPEEPCLPRCGGGSVAQQMSVDSGPCISFKSHSNDGVLNGETFDVNANPADVEDLDNSAVSTTGCPDETDSSERDASVQFDQRQVRFSLSQGARSSTCPSSSTVTSSTDSPMDISTVASGSTRSSACQPRSILRQQSAPTPSYNPFDFDHAFRTFRQMNSTSALPRTQMPDGYSDVFSASGSTPNMALPINPPSYYDSQMATAFWISQGFMPQNLDNGHVMMNYTTGNIPPGTIPNIPGHNFTLS